MVEITITSMKIGDYEVPPPHGLSELINRAGAWGIKKEDSIISKEYDRKVIKRDGQLVTILTKKR